MVSSAQKSTSVCLGTLNAYPENGGMQHPLHFYGPHLHFAFKWVKRIETDASLHTYTKKNHDII